MRHFIEGVQGQLPQVVVAQVQGDQAGHAERNKMAGG